MGLVKSLVVLLAVGALAYFVKQKLDDVPSLPVLDDDAWWGAGEKRKLDEGIRPFKIQVSDEVIQDLHSSLDRYLKKRPTPPLEHQGFQYGFNSDYLGQVVSYWRHKYQWRQRETYLNQFPQFKTWVNGLEMHFIRVGPKGGAGGKRVLPLLLMHGWPGSVREFYDVIPLLTTPRPDADFVFEVVAPSLPGYGFSQGAARPGLGSAQMAVIMRNLMKRIGYEKFYVQGGDWGGIIAKNMGTLFPRNVLGVHSNMCGVNSVKSNLAWFVGSFFPSLVVEEKFKHKMYPATEHIFYILEESGYFHLQATKPDTIGTALGDSPVGLAAYILEKFSTWTNREWKKLPDGGLTKKFTLDALLDNVMVYLVTGSITTSQRLYAETFAFAHTALRLDDIPIQVPTACARFANELMWQSDYILREKFLKLLQVSDFDDGGHFAAFEMPKELSNDVFSAVVKFENHHRTKQPKQK